MTGNFLLIDGNSIGNAANASPKLTLGSLQVQGIFGFLRTMRKQVSLYQHCTPIVLWDGASWRNMMFPDYKANRDKRETKHDLAAAEAKAHYKKQVPYVRKALRMLGIAQVSAMNMEADDLAAIMADRYTGAGHRVTLLTADRDWLQLVNERTVWRDPIHNFTVNAKTFEEFTGVPDVKQFVQMKALTGDVGDNIGGVGGVGDKGAIEFLKAYGSFNNFLNMVTLEKTVDIKKLPKKFRDLIEDEGKAILFDRNIKLMDLRTTARPAPFNLLVDKGDPNLDTFTRFCELLLFKSITDQMATWVSVFPHFREPVAA